MSDTSRPPADPTPVPPDTGPEKASASPPAPASVSPSPGSPSRPAPALAAVSPRKRGWVRWVISAAILLLVGGAFARMAMTPSDPLADARALLEARAVSEVSAEEGKAATTRARGAYQRCARLCVLDMWVPLERCMEAAREDSPDLKASRQTCWRENQKRFEPCLQECGEASKTYAGVTMDPMVTEMLASVSREDARRLTDISKQKIEKVKAKSAEIGGVLVSRGAAESAAPNTLESLLPYLTEGSLFLLLGFGMGALTRMLIKAVLLVAVLLVAGMMFLEVKEFGALDWGPMLDWVRMSVLNLSKNESVADLLTTKVPSMGTLALGFLIGLRGR